MLRLYLFFKRNIYLLFIQRMRRINVDGPDVYEPAVNPFILRMYFAHVSGVTESMAAVIPSPPLPPSPLFLPAPRSCLGIGVSPGRVVAAGCLCVRITRGVRALDG